jgi:SAM-dependent methyltransferase
MTDVQIKLGGRTMTQTKTADQQLDEIQARLNAFWSTRRNNVGLTALNIRNEQELRVWMQVLEPLLPPPPADTVDLGTGQGFLALVFAALGHRSRGYDLAEGMLERAREFAAASNNPPVFDFGDAMAPPLEPSSVDVVANRNVMWTLLDPEQAFRNWFTALRPGGRLIALHGVENGNIGREPIGAHAETYTEEVRGRLLGIHRLPTVDPALPVARAAGFADVQARRLEPIEEFERQLDAKAGTSNQKTWLALTAVRPR